MAEIQYRDWEIQNEAECFDIPSEELGNCPNCAAVVVRESVFVRTAVSYYWPCTSCGFTWHGADIPALD
jgi:predicted RNA-binding Zn-ribbon protein involved in translation (DUF1610 family)